MARSKKALSQKVVSAATTGMPSPIRRFLSSRIIALLIVLILPVLYLTGVVSVEWQNGRPRLNFNRQRAQEVREETASTIHKLKKEADKGQGVLQNVLTADRRSKQNSFTASLQPQDGLGDKLADGVERVRERLSGQDKPRFSLTPGKFDPNAAPEKANRLQPIFNQRR